MSRKPACGRFIFGHSLSEEKTGKWFVSVRRHTSERQRHVKRGTAQRLFALGIIFQLAWHVREAALPRKPVEHSKQPGAPWQPPAWD